MSTKEECEEAETNPRCPYITQINNSTIDLQAVKKALLGEDGTGMKSGIVYEITRLKQSNYTQQSWVNIAKPIIIAAAASLITFLLTKLAGQ